MPNRKYVLIENEDGDEYEVSIPLEYELCHVCEGSGKQVNPNIDGHGLSRYDFEEDPDFAEDYFSGVYDVNCTYCGGKRVQETIDWDSFKAENSEAAELYTEKLNDDAYFDHISRMEKKMGA